MEAQLQLSMLEFKLQQVNIFVGLVPMIAISQQK